MTNNAKTSEKIIGDTPNGGTYCVAFFLNEEKKPTTKRKARFVEIVEYDNNDNEINRTYSSF